MNRALDDAPGGGRRDAGLRAIIDGWASASAIVRFRSGVRLAATAVPDPAAANVLAV